MTDLSNIVLMVAQAGKTELLGEALIEMVTLTRREPGCAVVELTQSANDPSIWMVYERWRGQEAFANHMEQPYVGRFIAQMGELLSKPADVQAYIFRG